MGARRKLNHLAVRIAVSDAAAWTGRRFYGGAYRVIPNGVAIPAGGVPAPRARAAGEPLRVAFVGQAVERKGLPVLLRAFEALRSEVPAELVIVGATAADVAPLLEDGDGVRVLGPVGDAEKRAALADADVLAAPSLGGESFGMVLTEAFAAGTPVVASDIPGYRGVVSAGRDGLLVPRGDATALAEALRGLALDPAGTQALGAEAATSAERYSWPAVAAEVTDAYAAAVGVPAPEDVLDRAAVRIGLRSADLGPRRPARRLPSLEPRPSRSRRAGGLARRTSWSWAPSARRPGRTSPSSASGWTRSAARSAPPAPRGCSSRSPSCASPWGSAPCPGTRSSPRRCPPRGRASPTRCRARPSACSCPPRCRRASGSPRGR